MNNFNVISKEFFNQYRNGDTFTLNLSEFTTRLQGNPGEILQLVETIEIGTIVNEDEAINITFRENASGTFAILEAPLLDFTDEGLYTRAALSIDILGVTVLGTCEGVTGSSNQELKIDSVGRINLLAAGAEDGETYQSIIIKVTTAPTHLTYKYGVNPNQSVAPDYRSPLDSNQQAYQANNINGVFQAMRWVGKEQGSSMGDVQVKFDSTVELYKHRFTIEHTFKVPYYVEGELINITDSKNPENLVRDNSLKYGNGFFFGGFNNTTVGQFEDLGDVGNVGYFDENFNGFEGFYTTKLFRINNSLGADEIEATLSNEVTFSIASSSPIGFSGGETIILTHSKLPTKDEYSDQTESFDDIWLFENLRQTEGAGTISGTIITDLTVTFNAGDLDVSFVIEYTKDQQDKLSDTSSVDIFYTIATQDLSEPDNVDRSNIKANVALTKKDPSVFNLVTLWQPDIYNHWDFFSGSKFFTNFDGWDGDLLGMQFSFRLDSTKAATIGAMNLLIVADTGTSFFRLSPLISFSIPSIVQTLGNPNQYQVLDTTIDASFNIPNSDDLGFVNITADIPVGGTPTQIFTGSIGVRVPWREWILNNSVPLSFVDYNKPNNNQNEKTSNYSGAPYTIKLMLSLSVNSLVNGVVVATNYELFSDGSEILDFDDNGGNGFVGVSKYFDEAGDPTDNIFIDQTVQIEIEFSHTLGVLSKTDIWGRIWIEEENDISQPWELSTDKDFTDPLNPLAPTDTLLTGNATLVEIVSVNNLVTLICATNKDNLIDGINYNIYGRLGSKL